GRWVLAVLSFAVAAVFATVWSASPGLRAAAAGRGAAVLLLLAHPAYAAGSLLAALPARGAPGGDGGGGPGVALGMALGVGGGRGRDGGGGAGVALGMLLGVAAGVALAAATLIPNFNPGTVLLGCGVAATGGAALDAVLGPGPAGEGGAMQGKVVLITGVGSR